MAICEKCFNEFNRAYVLRTIDGFWGEGCYDWATNGERDLCEFCATEILELHDEDSDLVDP